MEELAKSKGFESSSEMLKMIASTDLTSPEKLNAFDDWKFNDGTKEGLQKLPSHQC